MRMILIIATVVTIGIAIQIYAALPLSLLLMMALVLYWPARNSLIASSILGLVNDLFLGSPLARHGYFYFFSCLIVVIYQRKFHRASIWFVAMFFFFLSTFYYWLFFRFIPWLTVLKLLLLMMAVHLSIGQRLVRESRRLKVS